jgi:predicted ATPase
LRKAWALGRVAEAIDANAEAYRLTESTGERYYQAIILWQRGWLLSLDIDGLQQAEAAFGQTLAVARADNRPSRSNCAPRSASPGYGPSRASARRNLLAPVNNRFTEGFDTADLKEAKGLLDDLA